MYLDRDVTDDDLKAAAREALTRPSDAVFYDDRLYTTHGPVLAWAERGDDILAESNYLTVLPFLESAAEDEEHVLDVTVRHWAVGSLRQIFVQVYEEDSETFTAAFREAVVVAHSLRDYPVWDEDDYSERELARFDSNLDDAIQWVIGHDEVFEDDSNSDAIVAQAMEVGALFDLFGRHADAEVSEDDVRRVLMEARDDFYRQRGEEFMQAAHPDQGALLDRVW